MTVFLVVLYKVLHTVKYHMNVRFHYLIRCFFNGSCMNSSLLALFVSEVAGSFGCDSKLQEQISCMNRLNSELNEKALSRNGLNSALACLNKVK